MIACIEFPAHYVCFPLSVFFKVSYIALWLIHFLTLNKLLGSCNKQGKEIAVKTRFS